MKDAKTKQALLLLLALAYAALCNAQLIWKKVDTLYGTLPRGMHVYAAADSLDGKLFKGFYVDVDLTEKNIKVTTDTTAGRRLTPSGFFEKLHAPALIINTSFFSFETNRNLNLVVKDGKILAANINTTKAGGSDSTLYDHHFHGAFGISKKRRADIAWVFSDTIHNKTYATQVVPPHFKDADSILSLSEAQAHFTAVPDVTFSKWKMQTAVGGGPVLVQHSKIMVSNNEEQRFAGKGALDRHPRSLVGYTANNHMIVMAVEGRNPGVADGVTLPVAALLMQSVGCIEALNLDGGGSSCMLVNGKETISPSDKTGQRPVPAVLVVEVK